jgi:hypothetical protein
MSCNGIFRVAFGVLSRKDKRVLKMLNDRKEVTYTIVSWNYRF